MPPSLCLVLTRVSLLVALSASVALQIHYAIPEASNFCGLESGCEVLRQTPLAQLFGPWFSLPTVGVLVNLGLFAWTFRRPSRADASPGAARTLGALISVARDKPAVLLFAVAFLGAAAAVQLIAYQLFWIEHACVYCLTVDTAAVASAVFSFPLALAQVRGQPAASEVLPIPAWAGLAAIAAGFPPAWQAVAPRGAVPERIAALYEPGKLNVVEIADFQCPYCRKLHAQLKPELQARSGNLNFKRLHYPLPNHHMAEPAARAALCAEEQGQGDAMADRLFQLTLTDETLQQAAEGLNLDPSTYDACLQAPHTNQRLASDQERANDIEGLPTLFVGPRKLVGVPSAALLREALSGAGEMPSSRTGLTLTVSALALAGLVIGWGRRTLRSDSPVKNV
jgi:protein-disulfide isomerase